MLSMSLRPTRAKFTLAAVLVLALATAMFAVPSQTAQAQVPVPISAGDNFRILSGFEDLGNRNLDVLRFFPGDITVSVGDTITWISTPAEPHTITFTGGEPPPPQDVELPDGRMAFNPQVFFPAGGAAYDGTGYANSGLLINVPPAPPAPIEYSLTFTEAGTYDYICVLHLPIMVGSVTVVEGDSGTTQASVDADIQAELADALAPLNAEAVENPSVQGNPDGTSDVTVFAGIGVDTGAEYMYFNEPNVTVNVNDTVTWDFSRTLSPHTVTFVGAGAEMPGLFEFEPQDAGPPNILLNGAAFGPSGGSTFHGEGLASSGLLFGPLLGPPGPPGNYSLTFTLPGQYRYYCLLHIANGMIGVVNVVDPGAGDGGADLPGVGDTRVPVWAGSLAGALGLIMVVGGAYLISRRMTR